MIRLLILSALGVAIGLFIAKLLSKQRDDDAIDGEVNVPKVKPRPSNLLPILLLAMVLAGLFLYILPRFGISVMGLLQKVMALLPLIRGFLPF